LQPTNYHLIVTIPGVKRLPVFHNTGRYQRYAFYPGKITNRPIR